MLPYLAINGHGRLRGRGSAPLASIFHLKDFCLTGTSMSFSFTFQTHSKSFVLQRLQYLLPLHFKDYQILFPCRDFNVFYLPLTFQRLSMSFIMQRIQCLPPFHFKDYKSLLSCREFNAFCLYILKTIKIFCHAGTSISSSFTIQRLSKSFA